jgi:hypothetical protein
MKSEQGGHKFIAYGSAILADAERALQPLGVGQKTRRSKA